jgi:hypothetical protein
MLASLPPLQQIPTAEEEVESLSSSKSQATDVNSEIWCYCKQPDDGSKMIGCDGKHCTIVWFHTAFAQSVKENNSSLKKSNELYLGKKASSNKNNK